MRSGDRMSPDTRKGRKRPFLGFARGLTNLLDWSGRLIVVVCLAAMFAALLVNVVLRYAMGSGIAWAYEIHAVLLPWLVAGGLVIASARSRNIGVTILSDMLPRHLRLWLNLLIQGVILAISVSVLWGSQPILKAAQFQTLSTLGIKQVWGYSSLAFAFAAMAMLAVLAILRTLSGKDVSELDLDETSLS